MKTSVNFSGENLQDAAVKKRISISLSGNFSSKVNYVFQIYRLALEMRINGFVKRSGANIILIEIEVQSNLLEKFLQQLKLLTGENEIILSVSKNKQLLNYNEFRIINLR
ncbi:MAG: acylphosphatase [Bacteroidales bacterium]|nr:acylphosphatase [Bacteroidales bacterium]